MTSVSEERKCFWAGDRNIIYITRTMQTLWSLCLYKIPLFCLSFEDHATSNC